MPYPLTVSQSSTTPSTVSNTQTPSQPSTAPCTSGARGSAESSSSTSSEITQSTSKQNIFTESAQKSVFKKTAAKQRAVDEVTHRVQLRIHEGSHRPGDEAALKKDVMKKYDINENTLTIALGAHKEWNDLVGRGWVRTSSNRGKAHTGNKTSLFTPHHNSIQEWANKGCKADEILCNLEPHIGKLMSKVALLGYMRKTGIKYAYQRDSNEYPSSYDRRFPAAFLKAKIEGTDELWTDKIKAFAEENPQAILQCSTAEVIRKIGDLPENLWRGGTGYVQWCRERLLEQKSHRKTIGQQDVFIEGHRGIAAQAGTLSSSTDELSSTSEESPVVNKQRRLEDIIDKLQVPKQQE